MPAIHTDDLNRLGEGVTSEIFANPLSGHTVWIVEVRRRKGAMQYVRYVRSNRDEALSLADTFVATHYPGVEVKQQLTSGGSVGFIVQPSKPGDLAAVTVHGYIVDDDTEEQP